MPPPTPNAGTDPVNINYVWGLSDYAAQTWVPPVRLVRRTDDRLAAARVFAPAHFVLARVMPRAAEPDACTVRQARAVCFRCASPGASCAAACAASACSSPASRSASWRLPASARWRRASADGLASAGRVILGGDLAFSLIQREADDAERAFLAAHGTSVRRRGDPARPWRARATGERHAGRGQGGRRRLSAVRHRRDRSRACRFRALLGAPRRRVRRRRRSGAAHAARSQARRPHHHRQCRDRTSRRARPPSRTSSPAASALGRACSSARRRCARAACCSPAAWCAGITGCGCPSAMRAMAPWLRSKDRRRAQFPDAGWDIRTRTKASPQLERNVERFSQFLTLVALTALLVGGVGVANAVASHLARKRDVIATMKALGATGAGVFAIYLHADLAGRAVRRADRRRARRARCRSQSRRASARSFRLPVAPSLLPGGAGAVDRLRPAHRARLRAVAARARARRFGVDAVPRPDRRRAALAAAALCHRDRADRRRARRRWRSCSPTTAASRRSSLRPPPAFSSRCGSSRMLLMAIARRLPRPRSTVLRLAIANIHRAGRA